MTAMLRKPAVAGSFYPGSKKDLEEMIAGMVDDSAPKEEVVGLICPHAGYIYSGPVAGAAVSRIQFAGTFIIMGPNHTGLGKPFSIMTSGTWETPLGNVEIDSELAQKLVVLVDRHERPDLLDRFMCHRSLLAVRPPRPGR